MASEGPSAGFHQWLLALSLGAALLAVVFVTFLVTMVAFIAFVTGNDPGNAVSQVIRGMAAVFEVMIP